MKVFPVLFFVHNFENLEEASKTKAKDQENKELPSASVRVLPPSPNTCAGHFDTLIKKKSLKYIYYLR